MGATYVTIQGNLIEDPTFHDGKTPESQLTRFRLASSKRYRTKEKTANGEDIWADTDHLYIDVKCWGKLANNCKVSLRRGHPVTVTGKLITETWSETVYTAGGKTDEVMRSRIALVATQVAFNLLNFQVASVKMESMSTSLPGLKAPEPRDARTFDQDEEEQRISAEDRAPGFASVGEQAGDQAGFRAEPEQSAEELQVSTPF